MNKVVTVIILAVVVIGGAYWLNLSMNGGYSTPTNTPDNSATPTSNGPINTANGSSGPYLVDRTGMTLYTNTKDENLSGKITPSCNAACEQVWLPYLLGATEVAPGKTSDPLLSRLNLFTRADGKTQYALGTKPLYRYASDKKAGDMMGAGVATWIVARP